MKTRTHHSADGGNKIFARPLAQGVLDLVFAFLGRYSIPPRAKRAPPPGEFLSSLGEVFLSSPGKVFLSNLGEVFLSSPGKVAP